MPAIIRSVVIKAFTHGPQSIFWGFTIEIFN